jgi:hypothetical protein
VRTNLALYSNTFSNAVWDNIGSSEASGQTGYDGTTNAWSLIENGSTSNHLIRQFPTVYGLTTLSVYAKAGSRDFVYLRGVQSSINVIAWFNLSTGTVGTVQTNGTGKIESVGNGWYRCSLTVANFQSPFELYVGLSNADNVTTYAGNGTGNILIQDFQYETGDVMTDYIPTTTAAVSVGPVSGLPRLDYLGSTCPKLLLEPQRTNLVTFSEQFNDSSYTQTAVSVSANIAISPDGYQNADKLIPSTAATNHYLTKSMTFSGAGALSVYAKADGYNFLILLNSSGNVSFDLSNGTATADGSMVSVGNGWYRCTFTKTFANGTMYLSCGSSSAPAFFSGAGDGTSGVLLYGFQLEAGSYATSYIPTLGASVTRVADAASKGSATALIGQTEGTLFVEGAFAGIDPANIRRIVSLSDGTTSNAVLIQNTSNSTTMQFVVVTLGTIQATITKSLAITFGQTFKAAFAYKENDFVAYINGEQVGTDILGTVPATSKFAFDRGNATTAHEGTISQALVFKTRLTNDQLAELTA